jgi:hypothetical protein
MSQSKKLSDKDNYFLTRQTADARQLDKAVQIIDETPAVPVSAAIVEPGPDEK